MIGGPGRGATRRIFKRGEEVRFIVFKRITMFLHRGDKYGHWWTEVQGKKSYGWWPKNPVDKQSTLAGVDGELNGTTSFRGTPDRDPHHGDNADIEFHPVVDEDDLTEDEIVKKIEVFSKSYHGGWMWFLGYGKNCHSFQIQMMKYVGLRDPRSLSKRAGDTCIMQ
jgi:hypothetical protein